MVLLLGNGINRFSSNHSWDTLVDSLIDRYGSGMISREEKPFTLLYEEILSRAVKNGLVRDESEILSFIAGETGKIDSNRFHAFLPGGYSSILTTNYDYAIEKALSGDSAFSGSHTSNTRETRYSLFRRIKAAGVDVWHIHGEARYPRTICLGYEHYSAYVQIMRNNLIKQDIAGKKKNADEVPDRTWMNCFFDSDVDIVGLSLDFVESDLWWLLIHRSRRINSAGIKSPNRIRYFIKKEAEYGKKTKAKIQMLQANNVFVVETDAGDYPGFYEACLNSKERSGDGG